jgi:hypothetical protein
MNKQMSIARKRIRTKIQEAIIHFWHQSWPLSFSTIHRIISARTLKCWIFKMIQPLVSPISILLLSNPKIQNKFSIKWTLNNLNDFLITWLNPNISMDFLAVKFWPMINNAEKHKRLDWKSPKASQIRNKNWMKIQLFCRRLFKW